MIASQIFSSVGIGLLIGILLGLSTSPVAGLVIGSVTALLASLIGVNGPGKQAELESSEKIYQERQKLIGIRAGVFGLTCVLGIIIGIQMRTHDVLSPPEHTLKQQFDELTEIGFSEQEARNIIITGAVDKGTTGQNGTAGSTYRSTVLFSIDSETCEQIDIDRFATLSTAIAYYQTRGLDSLVNAATLVDGHITDEQVKKEFMRSILELVCRKD